MPIPSPQDRRRTARRESSVESAPYVAGMTAAAATAVFALVVPPMLVLPVLSVALVALGLALAGVAWRAPASLVPTSRYLSAALTFIGFGAAFLTDVEQALPFFESARRSP